MGRWRRVLALATVVAAVVQAAPARASGSGAGTFHCTATFPMVPAPTPTPGGTCNGVATVLLAGVDGAGLPYRVTGTGLFAAAFTYQEPCVVNGQPGVLVSFADGVVTIVGLPAEHPIGVVTTATITSRFSWRRVGLHPAITVAGGPAAVTFANGGTADIGPGVGTATFLPPTNYSPAVHQCGAGGPAFIDVVGMVALSA